MPALPRYLLLILCSLCVSCSDDGGVAPSAPAAGCETETQNRFVHELLQDFYLWYEDIPGMVDYAAFATPGELLEQLVDRQRDRFSYITDAQAFINLFSAGQFTGYGFSYAILPDNTVQIRFVYADAPAGRAGLQRGDRLLSINGASIAEINNTDNWATIFGPDTVGHPLSLVVRKADDSVVTMNLQKAVVNINTVLHSSIIQVPPERIGYLVFNSFLQTSTAELEQVFARFKGAAVNRVILDLRYNGGGNVNVANDLASYLHAVQDRGQLFTSLVYNDKHQSSNSHFFLAPLLDALEAEQVIIITTPSTCSASEMIINGLQPFAVDIKTVGDTTCGKPVGMNPFSLCDSMLVPVTFQSVNRDGEGDYFDGIAADCAASDDLDFDFGDSSEPMLAEALHLARNDSCSPASRQAKRPLAQTRIPTHSLRSVFGAY